MEIVWKRGLWEGRTPFRPQRRDRTTRMEPDHTEVVPPGIAV